MPIDDPVFTVFTFLYSGSISNIDFKNITITSVLNFIIIKPIYKQKSYHFLENIKFNSPLLPPAYARRQDAKPPWLRYTAI